MKNQDIVQAIHGSTADVFSTMLGLEVVPGPVRTSLTTPPVSDGVISFVGVSGSWSGTGVISCTADFACKLCGAFLMTEAATVNEEVLDAVGELANMIIGGFKTVAEAQVGPLALSVPTVVFGTAITSRTLGITEWTIMPFSCGADTFEVRVWFKPANLPNSARPVAYGQPYECDHLAAQAGLTAVQMAVATECSGTI